MKLLILLLLTCKVLRSILAIASQDESALIRNQRQVVPASICNDSDLGIENFSARLFSSCGKSCCEQDFQTSCTAIYIGGDNFIVPATCVYGYTCFTLCVGTDSCNGQDGLCYQVENVYLYTPFISDLNNRGCLGQNLALVVGVGVQGLTPVNIPIFNSTNCNRFAGETNLQSIGCGSNCLPTGSAPIKTQTVVQVQGISATVGELDFPAVSCTSSECTTIFVQGVNQPGKFSVSCQDEGSPLLIQGQTLLKYDLDCDFKQTVDPQQYYFLGFLSYYQLPCTLTSSAAFLCADAFTSILKNVTISDWTSVYLSRRAILQTGYEDYTVDSTYDSYGLVNFPDTSDFQSCITKFLNCTLQPLPSVPVNQCVTQVTTIVAPIKASGP